MPRRAPPIRALLGASLVPLPFELRVAAVTASAAAESSPPGSAYHCGAVLSKHSDGGRGPKLAPSRAGLAVGGLRGRRGGRSEVGRVVVRVVAVGEPRRAGA